MKEMLQGIQHATNNPRKAHPTFQDWGGLPLEAGWVLIPF